jgi:serine protease AprX
MKDLTHRPGRGRSALALALLTCALLAAAAVGARSAPATSNTAARSAHRAPSIDPAVRQGLAHRRTIAATVAAWNWAGLREIESLGIRGTKLRSTPMVLAHRLTRAQFHKLARMPEVRSISANRRYELSMEDTTWITRARYAWSPAGPIGGPHVTGKGVDVAVIDTGADGQHEDMDNLVEFCETQQAVTGSHTELICSPFNPASGNAGPAGLTNTARGDSTDDPGGEGHGSHVSGTIAGTGDASGGRANTHSTLGMAPNANLHVYSANIGPSLLSFEIEAAYDDLIFKKTHNISRVVAVSNSWGGGDGANYDPEDATNILIKQAYDAGILSVFAAGNSGAEHNTLSRQCVNPYVVCVAASTKPDSVVMFSSRGRPSEPADTNRNGQVGDAEDIPPDNHDRRLAQAYDLGLYRPSVTAPGANIFSINANSATCRELLVPHAPPSDCYVAFNGTSMATPHVTGLVALITEAYRKGHSNRTPTPGTITDILERSSNVKKLPGYESEEQGAGRIDAVDATKFARTYPNGLPKPNMGTATPPYAAGQHPGSPGSISTETGCTGTLSWTAPNVNDPILDPVGQPPVSTQRYGQHTYTVAPKTERLRITVSWPNHPGANLYVRLWRPGVNPDAEGAPAGPTRVFPDQEATGLLDTADLIDSRWVDIKAPEEGTWTMRVYHRAGGASDTCNPNSAERPKQTEGFNYDVKVERPIAQFSPTVNITSPAHNATVAGRFVNVSGTAGYPTPWDGVTNWEVPGTGNPKLGPSGPDTRPVLHFQGNAEEGCSGDGMTDVLGCDGPFLDPNATLSAGLAASWFVPDPLFNEDADRSIVDPNWVWHLNGTATTVSGPMTVEWWASCGLCAGSIGFSADWRISLWADGVKLMEPRLTVTPANPNIPEKLVATVNVPTATASNSFVLKIDPVYIDSQSNTRIWYDSLQSCPGVLPGSGACDSIVRMPVGSSGGGGPSTPTEVRVADVHNGLRVAWNGTAGSTYEIYRSTDPTFAPVPTTRIATTGGTACNSPNVPSWPSASRPGRCYTDTGASSTSTTYYYRVVQVQGTQRSDASLLAYGSPTQFDRQVKLKVDRLYGPQYWEYATLGNTAGTSWSLTWDTLELATGNHSLSARSFTQGIGSTKGLRTLNKQERAHGGGGGRDDDEDDEEDEDDDDRDDEDRGD